MGQWSRLDPSEILVHNVKCQDQIDDLIEARMRKQFVQKLDKQARQALKETETTVDSDVLQGHIKEFVNCQSIQQLQDQTSKQNSEWWQDLCDNTLEDSFSSSESDSDELGKRSKPVSKALFKAFNIGHQYKKQRKAFDDKVGEVLKQV